MQAPTTPEESGIVEFTQPDTTETVLAAEPKNGFAEDGSMSVAPLDCPPPKLAIIPTQGRIVLYCLSEEDADAINRCRTQGNSVAVRAKSGHWPMGAQAHLGNAVLAGDVFPAMVVRVIEDDLINIQVFLDGTDIFWAANKSVSDGPVPGCFHWMPYQKQQVWLK